jgi:hypothetical protein
MLIAEMVDVPRGNGQHLISERVMDVARRQVEDKALEDSIENSTVRMLTCIREMISAWRVVRTDGDTRWYTEREVYERFKIQDEFADLKSKKSLTRKLRSIGINVGVAKVDGKPERCYLFNLKDLDELWDRYRPPSTRSVTVTSGEQIQLDIASTGSTESDRPVAMVTLPEGALGVDHREY